MNKKIDALANVIISGMVVIILFLTEIIVKEPSLLRAIGATIALIIFGITAIVTITIKDDNEKV